jgi:hypothetical protein
VPYEVPTFNLFCDIYTSEAFVLPRLTNVMCNLALGRRTGLPTVGPDPISHASSFPGSMSLLLPALTDIRMVLCLTGADNVEVPSGSGRFYRVMFVDDAGKGFSNEHRVAVISAVAPPMGVWPTPIP